MARVTGLEQLPGCGLPRAMCAQWDHSGWRLAQLPQKDVSCQVPLQEWDRSG